MQRRCSFFVVTGPPIQSGSISGLLFLMFSISCSRSVLSLEPFSKQINGEFSGSLICGKAFNISVIFSSSNIPIAAENRIYWWQKCADRYATSQLLFNYFYNVFSSMFADADCGFFRNPFFNSLQKFFQRPFCHNHKNFLILDSGLNIALLV